LARSNTRKKSSRLWLNRQHKDIFVKKSKQQGYRSRAAYKLLELQEKYHLLRPGIIVLDLGAAPGSWSQVAANIIFSAKNNQGKLIAVDILPIEPIQNVDIIEGDLTHDGTLIKITDLLLAESRDQSQAKVDMILSDMAPNLSGIWDVDIPKAMYLSELVLSLAEQLLTKNGSLVIKLFNGEGFDKYLMMLRKYFAKVTVVKPKSSRSESREVYVVARGYNFING
jgi:23S rRNA (uridine2552-2'-O)-methyltransferase